MPEPTAFARLEAEVKPWEHVGAYLFAELDSAGASAGVGTRVTF